MSTSQNKILDSQQIAQKIRRIAYQIYEQNFGETSLVFVGIKGGGYLLAEALHQVFCEISATESQLYALNIDKIKPIASEIVLEAEPQDLENKVIILVDDVLNTGRTLTYALEPFLNIRVKRLQTVVLVNRNHADFPIAADYEGYALSTTLNEHIEVLLKPNSGESGVYLS